MGAIAREHWISSETGTTVQKAIVRSGINNFDMLICVMVVS